MNASTRRWLVAGIVLLAVLVLIAGTALIAWVFFSPAAGFGPPAFSEPFLGADFESNGERIYFTGTSATGPPIDAQMPGMHRMSSGMMACVTCHGEDGRGGQVRMMMSTFEAPDIRYETLIQGEHEDEHADHPPYTEETIKQAITEGVDPSGEPLDWAMPRWEMTEDQLDDLIAYLKTLD